VTQSDTGKISIRLIIIQIVIVAVVAGVYAYVKVYLPQAEKAREAAQIAERESRIHDFLDSMVAEDPSRTVEAPGVGKTHPQSLRSAPDVADVQQALGAPDSSTTDFAGGQHLTWIGTGHTLEASFNRGQLYCLSFKDNSTGHGVNVYTSSAQWQPF
jgi:hypothetical protein